MPEPEWQPTDPVDGKSALLALGVMGVIVFFCAYCVGKSF